MGPLVPSQDSFSFPRPSSPWLPGSPVPSQERSGRRSALRSGPAELRTGVRSRGPTDSRSGGLQGWWSFPATRGRGRLAVQRHRGRESGGGWWLWWLQQLLW